MAALDERATGAGSDDATPGEERTTPDLGEPLEPTDVEVDRSAQRANTVVPTPQEDAESRADAPERSRETVQSAAREVGAQPAAAEPPAEPIPVAPEAVASGDTSPASPMPEIGPAVPEIAPEAESRARRPRVPWWPFMIYLGFWIVGVGAAAWLFLTEPAVGSVAGESTYPYMLRAGLVLTALGPALALVVWFISWFTATRGTRSGLFADSMLKGALTTLSGVVVWWLMLMIVDRVRFDQLW
jgi:hypothetical protein